MKRTSANKNGNKLPPVEKQRPLMLKNGDIVKLVMFDDCDNAVIEELKVRKLIRSHVEKTKNGLRQIWSAVLKPIRNIKVDGKNEVVIDADNPVISHTDRMAIYKAFEGFRYESPEERLLKAIFGDDDGNEAKFRSLVKLAYKVVKETEKDFRDDQKYLAKAKKEEE